MFNSLVLGPRTPSFSGPNGSALERERERDSERERKKDLGKSLKSNCDWLIAGME